MIPAISRLLQKMEKTRVELRKAVAKKGGRLLGQLAADSGGTYTTPPAKKVP